MKEILRDYLITNNNGWSSKSWVINRLRIFMHLNKMFKALVCNVVIFSASERITYVGFIFRIIFVKMWIGRNIRGPALNFCPNNFYNFIISHWIGESGFSRTMKFILQELHMSRVTSYSDYLVQDCKIVTGKFILSLLLEDKANE